MKTTIKTKLAVLALAFTAVVPSLHAQLTLPNADGSDGAFIIGTNLVIDLSKAVSGSWTNTSASPGNGTYDPTQWAVVFKYSSVIISNGATVSFLNNATHAPVVWLVQSNVTINGTLNLDGQPGSSTDPSYLAEPGPGGFRGGNFNGSGFGPGGGFGVFTFNSGFYSSTYPYGNLQIVPLIGGSGGSDYSGTSGGGGGGAILIAASGIISIPSGGSCHAYGGTSYRANGSGGAIRLIAGQILGGGNVQATGGQSNDGRIRLEATNSTSLNTTPPTTVVSPFPLTIFPTDNSPTVSIVSIISQPNQTNTPPVDPKAQMNTAGDDMMVVTTSNVVIQVKTTNFPTNGTVNVYLKPLNAAQTIISTSSAVSGNSNTAIWQVNAALPYPSHTVIQARAVY